MRFLDRLKTSRDFQDYVVWHEEIASKPAAYADLERPLPDALQRALEDMGVERLYAHQARAIDLIRQGRHVVTSTPTASGKSMIYNLPVFEAALTRPGTKALYLFPLKALEQDQLKTLNHLSRQVSGGKIRAAVYDGDTSPYRRKKLRDDPPEILITNPDMLHLSLLAYHDSWADFWPGLSFVVIDEVHTYRGIFGSHLAQILRRLHRLMDHYGAKPVFILSSATIGNPAEFAGKLTGLPFEAVTESGAPSAGKHFLFMNPTFTSAAVTATRIFLRAVGDGLRAIAFTPSRRTTELMHTWARQMAPSLAGKLSSYRAGFLPSERREIEQKLASGELLGVISTSALELGLDIGELEVCILIGYPGSIIRTWQRGGRVGRTDRESAVILLAQPDALDQYFMRHPQDFFGRGFEPAVLDPDNEPVMLAHLPCAAAEMPLESRDPYFTPDARPTLMDRACQEGRLLRTAEGGEYFPARRRPHREVDIRTPGEGYTIVSLDKGQVIGAADSHRVFRECHPGAVYYHRAETWVITELDLERRNARARRMDVDYYTRSQVEKETEILEVLQVKPVANCLAKLGRLRVRERVVGYEKRLIRGQELVGSYPLDLPEMVFETEGLWFEFEDFVPASLDQGQHYMGGIHAVEHAAIGLFPLVALCDRDDMGGISYPLHPELGKGAVFIYDGYSGGVGLSRGGFEVLETLLEKTLDLIASCECEAGCPSCIHSPKCGNGNKPLDKAAAIRVLEVLLGKRPLPSAGGPSAEGPDLAMDVGWTKPAEPPPLRLVVFDLETKRSAAEVGGWNKAHLMGLAAGVVYDVVEDRYHVYEEGQVKALVDRLLQADLVIGFNQMRFDYPVLSAYTTQDLRVRPNLDLLQEIYTVLGRRVSLNHLGQATLSREKTANGLASLEWVKQGRLDLVKAYCQEDVRLTFDLFAFARDNGYLLFEDKEGRKLRVPLDVRPERFLPQSERRAG